MASRDETWVQKVADALHETCLNEWRAIVAVDPKRQITQHMSDAHYGTARDLVRRLNLATHDAQGSVARDGEPQTEAGRALLDDWRNDGPTYNFARRILAIETEAVRPWRSSLNWALSELMLSESESRAADPMYRRAYTNARALLDGSAE